ncbi:MAG: hydrogenase maturation protease [Acidimicrobiales bacterium]
MTGKVLVAGIGNIFLGDDGFGVEVANRLALRSFPPEVKVADFGIRGVHLAYELLDDYDYLILIDAVPMDEDPGTLAVIEPQGSDIPTASGPEPTASGPEPVLDAHSMNPAVVLGTLAHLGGQLERVLIVGCQPANLEEGIGLSPSVEGVIGDAVELCCDLVAEIHAGAHAKTPVFQNANEGIG